MRRIKDFFKDPDVRWALWVELFYVVLLLLTLLFNFSLFMHLVVGQFFLIGTYFVIGWIYYGYLKVNGLVPENPNKKRRSLGDIFARIFPRYSAKKTFYRILNLIVVILAVGLAIQVFGQVFYDLGLKNNNFNFWDSLALYCNIVCFIALVGIAIGLLMGYRRMVRNSSIAALILTIILAMCWPQFWVTYILILLVAFNSFWVYLHNQI